MGLLTWWTASGVAVQIVRTKLVLEASSNMGIVTQLSGATPSHLQNGSVEDFSSFFRGNNGCLSDLLVESTRHQISLHCNRRDERHEDQVALLRDSGHIWTSGERSQLSHGRSLSTAKSTCLCEAYREVQDLRSHLENN